MRLHGSSQRGTTLIESMAALGVMLVGAIGFASLYHMGVQTNGDARRITRATAIAQDLLNNIELWPYQAPNAAGPLQNTNTGNDADFGDTELAFEKSATPPADHGEADLPAGFTGIPVAQLGTEYERYWNVAYPTTPDNDANGNGIPDSVKIAVIVRWQQTGGWRRIVLVGAKPNPQER